jgi:DNA modification methylase
MWVLSGFAATPRGSRGEPPGLVSTGYERVSAHDLRNTVMNADCLEILLLHLAAESADFILTDRPYLARDSSRDGRTVLNDDNVTWLELAFARYTDCFSTGRFCVSSYGWPHADRFIQAFRIAGFQIVEHFVFPKARHFRLEVPALSARMRAPSASGTTRRRAFFAAVDPLPEEGRIG